MVPKKNINPTRIEKLNGINSRTWKMDQVEAEAAIRSRNKWEEHNAWVRALVLHCMNDDIIHLFEYYETTKEVMEAVEGK